MKIYTKVLLSFSLLFILLMVSVSFFQYIRERDYRREQLNFRLSAYNDIIYYDYIHKDSSQIVSLVKLMPDSMLRATIIDKNGIVLFDSYSDSVIENHLLREEIQALNYAQSGSAIRKSSLDGLEYYYFAQKFGDVYVRTALPYNVTLASSLKSNMDFIYFFAVSILVVMILIFIISEKLSESVKKNEQRQRRQLTQNVSHELKTPVAAILGYTESLVNNPDMDASKQKYFIQRTYQQSRRLSTLLEDISTLNKLNENVKLYEKEPTDLVSIIYEVINDTEEAAKAKNISIEMSLPPDIIINGNKSLLYSIFRNLIDNSISYAGEDVVVKISLTHFDPQYYYFSVRDNGCGISYQHIAHIFDRFYRVDKGRSRKSGGTGLGLSIVKNAVAFHRGAISAQSLPSGGFECMFSLHK